MSDAQNSAAASGEMVTASKSSEQENHNQNPSPVFSFISNLLNLFNFKLPPLPFPFPHKNEVVDKPSASAASDSLQLGGTTSVPDGPHEEKPPPRSVSYPRRDLVSLKLEGDDFEARETKPGTLWMAYAIGGYLVVTWAWTRWNERRSRRNPSNDRPPPNSE